MAQNFGQWDRFMENSAFSPHPFHRGAPLMPQVWDVKTAQLAQLDLFGPLPEALAGVQLRSIGRQALRTEVLHRAATAS